MGDEGGGFGVKGLGFRGLGFRRPQTFKKRSLIHHPNEFSSESLGNYGDMEIYADIQGYSQMYVGVYSRVGLQNYINPSYKL